MTISYAGSLTLGQALPMALTAQVALADTAGAALPDLQARVAGLISLGSRPSPTLPDLIAGAAATLAALQQMVSLPVPDLGATATALADLQSQLAEINAGLSFSSSFASLLATAGVHYYVFEGRAGDLSGDLALQLSAGLPGGDGPAELVAGCVLLASDAAAISALQTVLRS